MEKITVENYLKYYPMFVTDGTEFEKSYELSNLHAYLKTGVNYEDIASIVDDVLNRLNAADVVKELREVRIDMNMDECFTVKLSTKLGRDLYKGDITDYYRTSTNDLPIFFTINEFYLAPNGLTFMKGADVGHILFEEDDYYVVAKIISQRPV